MIADNSADLGVLTLVDSLAIGGTERVAVSIANQLAEHGIRSCLCTTREQGPLASSVSQDVHQLHLNRSRIIEWGAIRRLVDFIREHRINVLHAHSSSILTANLASRFSPFPRIVWHDHFGLNDQQERSPLVYRCLTKRAGGAIAVSQPLADWSHQKLRIPTDRVWCLPNFVPIPEPSSTSIDLPGQKGNRIACVANVRPVKDHLTLVQAFQRVNTQVPKSHLLLIGGLSDTEYVNQVRSQITELHLEDHVTLLGPRNDVPQILQQCDVGVLASTSEGLPVSLLEYGAAGLPVVVTDVGQCGDVVDQGKAGVMVPPSEPDQHANAMIGLLQDPKNRASLADRFHQRVKSKYGADSVINALLKIYDMVLSR